MRGKAACDTLLAALCGITPAYAGKSISACGQAQQFKDHPRLCGEKHLHQTRHQPAVGSPPPMRGKVPCNHDKIPLTRITPAYAGKR